MCTSFVSVCMCFFLADLSLVYVMIYIYIYIHIYNMCVWSCIALRLNCLLGPLTLQERSGGVLRLILPKPYTLDRKV